MGRAALCMRAAALLAAAGMFLFLAGGISADDGYIEAGAARALKPTQAIAEVPEEYNELFTIQWGGGSLYHLKARLATMGCMLNTIWVYDNNRWYGYNQYNVPTQFNQPFLTQFIDGIPATTLYGSCIDICTFDAVDGVVINGRECTTFEELVDHDKTKISSPSILSILPIPIESDTSCTDDFNPVVKEKIFLFLPILPNTCIVRQITINIPSIQGTIGTDEHLNSVHFVILWINPQRSKNEKEEVKESWHVDELMTEVHELCHIQQRYHLAQQETSGPRFSPYNGWYDSEANKEFMRITGFTESVGGIFQLPNNSVFKEIYSTNPTELSAELCALYLLDKIGQRSDYDIDRPNFNLNRYLTPQVVQWLETYMVLPYPNYDNE